jgi:hypothetical protein
MFKTTTLSAAALAAAGFAAPAMAQQNLIYDPDSTVDVDVLVERIAVLEVVDGQGKMIIDDDSPSFMGNPSSSGDVFDTSVGDFAELRLSTNFDIESVDFSYDTVRNIRNDPTDPSSTFNGTGFEVFGRAIGQTSGNVLGVYPQVGVLDGAGNIIGGGGGIFVHDGSSGPLGTRTISVDGPDKSTPTGFANGTHEFAVGVSTDWSRTRLTEPQFAVQDTYRITLDATIVPGGSGV